MNENQVKYKTIDPRCIVKVREINRHIGARKLITNHRKKSASAGLVIASVPEISLGALVEIDVSFPGIPVIYRSKGIVDWETKNENRMGIVVFGMDKINPSEEDKKENKQSSALPISQIPEQSKQPIQSEQPEVTAKQPSTTLENKKEPAAAKLSSAPPAPAVNQDESSAEKAKIPGLKMPDDEDVSELFAGLLDSDIDVSENKDKPLKAKRFAAIGEYKDDSDQTALLMVADLALINYLGSALVMLPKDEAENATKNGTFTDEIRESFQEIFNISSSLINDAGNKHVKFSKMYCPKTDTLPEEISSLIDNYSARLDLNIRIPGYGSGRLSLLDGTWK